MDGKDTSKPNIYNNLLKGADEPIDGRPPARSAVFQLSTTWISRAGASGFRVAIRNRWPSAVTSQRAYPGSAGGARRSAAATERLPTNPERDGDGGGSQRCREAPPVGGPRRRLVRHGSRLRKGDAVTGAGRGVHEPNIRRRGRGCQNPAPT